MSEPATDSKNQKLLHKLIMASAIILLLTIILAIIFYNDDYQFLKDYISYSGGNETILNGNTNTIAKWIFTIGFILTAILALIMAIIYSLPNNKSGLNILKAIFLYIMAIGGCIVGIMQHDDNVPFADIHDIGATSFYLGFDFFVFFCQFARYRKHKIEFAEIEDKNTLWDRIVVTILLATTVVYIAVFLSKTIMPEIETDVHPILVVLQKTLVLFFFITTLMLDDDDF